jgi:glutathione S-transferase
MNARPDHAALRARDLAAAADTAQNARGHQGNAHAVSAQITLYSFVPFDRSCRVRWLAHELGIGIQERRLDYAGGEHRGDAYLALHPFGLVPTAIIDDEAHWESGAICQLLVDAFPESELMVSRDSADYATYLSWLFFSASTFDAASFQVFNYASLKPNEERKREAVVNLAPLLVKLSRHVRRNNFLLGDQFTLPDILIGHALQLLFLVHALDEYPDLMSYRDRLRRRPAARASGVFTPRPG